MNFLKTILLFIVFYSISATAQQNRIVEVWNNYFNPNSIVAFEGDTITWLWREGIHTTTSLTIPFMASSWDAEINAANKSFKYVIDRIGDYNYYCKNFGLIDNMSGFIFVAIPNFVKKEIASNFFQFLSRSKIELNNEVKQVTILNYSGQNISYNKPQANQIELFQNGLYIVKIELFSGEQFAFKWNIFDL
jgi:plastocyanin